MINRTSAWCQDNKEKKLLKKSDKFKSLDAKGNTNQSNHKLQAQAIKSFNCIQLGLERPDQKVRLAFTVASQKLERAQA